MLFVFCFFFGSLVIHALNFVREKLTCYCTDDIKSDENIMLRCCKLGDKVYVAQNSPA